HCRSPKGTPHARSRAGEVVGTTSRRAAYVGKSLRKANSTCRRDSIAYARVMPRTRKFDPPRTSVTICRSAPLRTGPQLSQAFPTLLSPSLSERWDVESKRENYVETGAIFIAADHACLDRRRRDRHPGSPFFFGKAERRASCDDGAAPRTAGRA